MLTDRQGVEISGVQSHNGAAFFYCVVGSDQIFAVYLYLDEIGKSCVGRKGQPVCAALLPCAVGSLDDYRGVSSCASLYSISNSNASAVLPDTSSVSGKVTVVAV